jgi:hypothetical protein
VVSYIRAVMLLCVFMFMFLFGSLCVFCELVPWRERWLVAYARFFVHGVSVCACACGL